MAAPTEAPHRRSFAHELLPVQVRFGAGRLAELGEALAEAGIVRALLVDGLQVPDLVARAEAAMGPARLTTTGPARQHVPEADAEAARELARELEADGLVALGGGSATGLAKAVALTEGLPVMAVPTTYAGSEMTPIWGVTAGERKTTGRDRRVAPRSVIYDPELTYSLPAGPTAASAMNAVAHCVEALWTEQATPLTDAVATEGLELLAGGLRAWAARPDDHEARAQLLRGAWLAGVALAGAGTALHHKLAHVLGGFGMPHAEVHALLLPEVTALFATAAPGAMRRVERALGADDAEAGLRALAREVGATGSLAAFGLTAEQTRTAAELAAAASPAVPRPAHAEDVLRILRGAGAPG